MRSLNPSVKAICLMAPTFFLAGVQKPMLNLTVFSICIVLMAISQVNTKALLGAMLPVLLISLGMFFTGYRFQSGAGIPVNSRNILVSDAAVWNGLVLSSRMLVFAGLGLLLVMTTDRVRLVQSLHQQLRLPTSFAYSLLAAWGVLPSMFREYRQTQAAFRARGILISPVSPALLRPMLVKSVRWAEALSVAMESKGFNGSSARTVYTPIPLRRRDAFFAAGILIMCLSLYFLSLRFTIF